ncbi:LuxR family transcriptional regulator, transcriptional activator of rhlAB and lasB [Pseudomonas cedrina]|uniref:LuxR family transcriptional regulator n=2 Tax=Pseudomonas cedrina TaxID=651740 RepID=A0A1V2JY17_PSECE|nr:autoinducer binding domain-containing protein [Pseudomonas cedrina]ONH50338.1 LuxR family transcriptional regulator [Pseudomonas cedrina subsp. cedrina]SDS84254.1 LuxR family transcriptional regulator, transcriptional activator of rhlAB and lasB [Pseudomonas cedrina]
MEKENDLIRWWNCLRIEMFKQQDETQVLALLEREVLQLGFEYYAYGVRHLTPFTRPKTEIYGSYPERWLAHYEEKNYAAIDPSILSGLRSTEMVVWNDALFDNSRTLWQEARDWGLRIGATLPIRSHDHSLRVLSVARRQDPISHAESDEIQLRLRCILEQVTLRLIDLGHRERSHKSVCLSLREREILQWTADGKSSGEIALILTISINTVNFHLKAIQKKFGAGNKTLAAAYAAALGLI